MNRVLQAIISSIGTGQGCPENPDRCARPTYRAALGGPTGVHGKLPPSLTGTAFGLWAWPLRLGRRISPTSNLFPRTPPLAEAGRAFDQLPLFRSEAMAA